MRRVFAVAVILGLAVPAWAGRAVVDWRAGVNVRTSPGTDGRLKGKIEAGVETEILEESGKWVRVRYPGGEGWVAKRSLKTIPDRPSRRTQTAEDPRPAPAEARPAAVPVPAPAVEPLPPNPAVAPAVVEQPAQQPVTGSTAAGPSYLSAYDREAPPARADAGPSLFTAVSALLLVLALVAGAVWLIRLLTSRRYFGAQKGRGIQVLATRPMGPRQALVLVEVGGLPLLLAQGEGGLHLISEIHDPEAVRRLNEIYGFRESPFEAELHRRLDLESDENPAKGGPDDRQGPSPEVPRGGRGPDAPAAGSPDRGDPSTEERLEALRRRRRPGEGP